VEAFFPRLFLPHVRPRQRPLVPLFPGYLFVHLTTPGLYDAVRWAPGISQIVSFAGQPAPLDDEVILFLQRRAGPDGILVARSPLVAGQGVEIIEGPLAGLAGIIAQPPDAHGRVHLLLQLLQRQVRVDVPVHILASQS
jgi:transcriptional antiterminator RfaH